tara:strand:- start:726 stop:1079 length:354 start_codon:yes stop_codon:yes gene_type:complete
MYSLGNNKKDKIKEIFKNKKFIVDNYDSIFHYEIDNNYLKAFFYSNKGDLFLNINIQEIESITSLPESYISIKKNNGNEIKFKFDNSEISTVLYHLSSGIMEHQIEVKNQNARIQSL